MANKSLTFNDIVRIAEACGRIVEKLAGRVVARSAGRKVRSPKGSVPANGREGPLKADCTESATENIPPTPVGKGEMVR